MRVLALGMWGALLVGVGSVRLYDCLYVALMVCRSANQSEVCASNGTAIAWALGGLGVGLAMAIAAIVWFRRRSPT